MDVEIKRIYEPASPKDNIRLFIDRLWPRGITKSNDLFDEWVKDIAPSSQLRKWYGHNRNLFPEFANRYRQELQQPPAKTALEYILKKFANSTNTGTITLLTATREVDISAAAVLRQVLQSKLK
ncbi:MAG: DUF488 family protein [Actinobacteria bacterium]|jgi:uncharacterized protein YeaO (DUF488 family)|nr:DUF488 family protein [Actinomycetota bacterium]MCL6105265.1 DUF488 family protein [Actinomycetota bacterium]